LKPSVDSPADATADSTKSKSRDALMRAAKFRQLQEDAVKRWRKREG
jgi:hypothetical protein